MDRSRRTPRHVRSQQVMDGIIEYPRGAGGTEALFPLEIITLLGTSPCIERARLARPRPHLICIDRHKNGRPGPPSILRSAKARQVDRRRTKKMDDGGRWNRAHPQRTARPAKCMRRCAPSRVTDSLARAPCAPARNHAALFPLLAPHHCVVPTRFPFTPLPRKAAFFLGLAFPTVIGDG